MFESYVIIFTLFSTVAINYFLIKKKLLLDKKYSPHKSFLNNDIVPLSGGIIFLLSICIFYPVEFYPFKLALCAIFLIGIFSDLNIISSPAKRIIIHFYTTRYFFQWPFLNFLHWSFSLLRLLLSPRITVSTFFKVSKKLIQNLNYIITYNILIYIYET